MVDESWQPKKLEVLLEAPDFLDLSHLRALPGATSGSSLRDGEVAMPEEVGAATQASAALPEVPAEAEQAVVMAAKWREMQVSRARQSDPAL